MSVVSSASVPGRVCFAGEDLDWMSKPSILCAIDLRVACEVSPNTRDMKQHLLSSGSPFNLVATINRGEMGKYRNDSLDYIRAAVKIICDVVGEIPDVRIDIQATLPASVGLSSSAAVSLSTIAALGNFLQLHLSMTEICEMAYRVESHELHTGAGQMDFYSCGLGGALYIDSTHEPPREIRTYSLPDELRIVIVDTLVTRRTRDVLLWKHERLRNREPLLLRYVDHTENLVREMRGLLEGVGTDVARLGRLMLECHQYLRDEMGVSTELLEECVDVAVKHGAFGAKLTGTGKGGCMFAIVHESQVRRVLSALSTLPVRAYPVGVASEGVVVS